MNDNYISMDTEELRKRFIDGNFKEESYTKLILEVSKRYQNIGGRGLLAKLRIEVDRKYKRTTMYQLMAQDILDTLTKPEFKKDFSAYHYVNRDAVSDKPMKLTLPNNYDTIKTATDEVLIILDKGGLKMLLDILVAYELNDS